MPGTARLSPNNKMVKSVVWDLDNTVWDGVLLEDLEVRPRQEVIDLIKTLDERGILQSIASKNDHSLAMARLRELGIDEYFLCPQINWNPKSSGIRAIADDLNIGLDSIAFIDDQPYERDEVRFSVPEVLCFSADDIGLLAGLPEFKPPFITEDSRNRRKMYAGDMVRKQAENEFEGPAEEFLASLAMTFTISSAHEEDLQRAEELTVRTNQLNTNGRTYSYDELNHFIHSANHLLLVAGLEDIYGSYGKIGLTLVEFSHRNMSIKLLLMSCRVMSRGVGTILLSHLSHIARARGLPLRAEFLPNDRNRMMYVTYRFAGFREIGNDGPLILLESDSTLTPSFPKYVTVKIQD